jgi:tetratricopeptide (TPR) repeat protein
MPSEPPKKTPPQGAPKVKSEGESDTSWQDELYTPERIEKWIRGEITMRELDGMSGADMLEIATMGYAQYENGKYEEARVIFTGLCALEPRESYFRTALGCVFLAQEQLDRAEQQFNEAVRLNPKDQAAFVNRGEVYLRQGRVMEAAQDFKAAVDLDPKNESPFSARAKALAAAVLETLEGEEVSQSRATPTRSSPPGKKK